MRQSGLHWNAKDGPLPTQVVITQQQLKLLVYDIDQEVIVKWLA